MLVEKWQLSKAQFEREKSVQGTELTLVSKKGSMDIRFSITTTYYEQFSVNALKLIP
jgi:hypothetical protein